MAKTKTAASQSALASTNFIGGSQGKQGERGLPPSLEKPVAPCLGSRWVEAKRVAGDGVRRDSRGMEAEEWTGHRWLRSWTTSSPLLCDGRPCPYHDAGSIELYVSVERVGPPWISFLCYPTQAGDILHPRCADKKLLARQARFSAIASLHETCLAVAGGQESVEPRHRPSHDRRRSNHHATWKTRCGGSRRPGVSTAPTAPSDRGGVAFVSGVQSGVGPRSGRARGRDLIER
jgi:hypothetical protein